MDGSVPLCTTAPKETPHRAQPPRPSPSPGASSVSWASPCCVSRTHGLTQRVALATGSLHSASWRRGSLHRSGVTNYTVAVTRASCLLWPNAVPSSTRPSTDTGLCARLAAVTGPRWARVCPPLRGSVLRSGEQGWRWGNGADILKDCSPRSAFNYPSLRQTLGH